MSFAYIDSQGKEVPIPGPDALRLRIELGAITDSTQFFDAGSDRWAPASEHEIYRQLKREISASQSGGFMAPPPSVIGPDPTSRPSAADDPVAEDPVGDDAGVDDPFADDPVAEDLILDDLVLEDPVAEEPVPDGPGTEEIDEIVTGGEEDDPSHDELLYPEGASAEEIDLGMDTFTLADPDAVTLPDDLGLDDESAAGDAFDFGSDALTLEDAGDEGVVDDTPDFGMAFEGGAPDDHFDAIEDDDGEADDETPGIDEPGIDEPGVDEADVEEAAERAVGGPSRAGAPEPSEAEADGPGDAAPDSGSRPDDPYRRVVRERRGPRSRPSGRGGSGSGSGSGGGARALLGVLVGAVVIAAGAWFAMGSGAGEGADSESAVVLPDLPADLEPQLRALARDASERMVAEFDSLPERVTLAPQPGPQWLSGAYLANAGSFPEVRDYWQGFEQLLDAVVASEDDIWASEWEFVLDSASLAPGVESQLRTRGVAGWAAAEPDRTIVHDQLRGVIDAARRLHAFLVTNESAIAYDPGSGGGAGDPVLEAVPDTPELGDEMWERVGEITVALDALGYLEQVETEALFGRVKAKLVATGIR